MKKLGFKRTSVELDTPLRRALIRCCNEYTGRDYTDVVVVLGDCVHIPSTPIVLMWMGERTGQSTVLDCPPEMFLDVEAVERHFRELAIRKVAEVLCGGKE